MGHANQRPALDGLWANMMDPGFEAGTEGRTTHFAIAYDPGQLAWPVNEIGSLEHVVKNLIRPRPTCSAGESDSHR